MTKKKTKQPPNKTVTNLEDEMAAPTPLRIEASTWEEKIYVLEYALKVAVTMRDQEFLDMKRNRDAANSEAFRLRREVDRLKRIISDVLPFTPTSRIF